MESGFSYFLKKNDEIYLSNRIFGGFLQSEKLFNLAETSSLDTIIYGYNQ